METKPPPMCLVKMKSHKSIVAPELHSTTALVRREDNQLCRASERPHVAEAEMDMMQPEAKDLPQLGEAGRTHVPEPSEGCDPDCTVTPA